MSTAAKAPKSSPITLTVLSLLHFKPLHPYGMQRLLKQWGKDQVVNVGQRTSLYRAIDRLLSAGLIAVRETGRDQQYPERTVYEITDAGREATRTWLLEMLREPRLEFPEFPVALSNLMLLAPGEIEQALAARLAAVRAGRAAQERSLAETAAVGVPRVAMLETEYAVALATAEADWLESVIADLRSGTLTWSAEELIAVAQASDAQAPQ
ncbi:PadR family transcriptional regulator [Streptantibioticus ferralitis]|uniref:PadR family transcriptional regulator n=1 Tax=Streptantibioticus ferralitis TaxID=236510 RepID=A0ABT5ZCS0_9ACTN|nr:PadR family transcriptional regulator [Streptantibioticus ferralitis]MDF2261579.1 PadR family transcriptional regulator [Streptantibioticus ferralitis]